MELNVEQAYTGSRGSILRDRSNSADRPMQAHRCSFGDVIEITPTYDPHKTLEEAEQIAIEDSTIQFKPVRERTPTPPPSPKSSISTFSLLQSSDEAVEEYVLIDETNCENSVQYSSNLQSSIQVAMENCQKMETYVCVCAIIDDVVQEALDLIPEIAVEDVVLNIVGLIDTRRYESPETDTRMT